MNRKKRIREIRDGVLYINCTHCGNMLPAENSFEKYKSGLYFAMCKMCDRERRRIRYAKSKNISAEEIEEKKAVKKQRSELREMAKQYADRAINVKPSNKANICIDCQKACGGCSWTRCETWKKGKPIMFQPVEGWTAEKIYRVSQDGYVIETYSITACPEFIPDEPRKTQDIVDGK